MLMIILFTTSLTPLVFFAFVAMVCMHDSSGHVPDKVTTPLFTVITTPGAATRTVGSSSFSISLSVLPPLQATSTIIKQNNNTRIMVLFTGIYCKNYTICKPLIYIL